MSWMDERIVTSDIQTAVQSQTIQTALEANTSKITDAGFQSYLTSAPIPRFQYTTITGTYATGAVTNTNWTTVNAIDPYAMMAPATGSITIPIDGFYQLNFGLKTVAVGAAGYIEVGWITGGVNRISTTLATGGAALGTFYGLSAPYGAFWRQGTVLNTWIGNTTGGAFTAASFDFIYVSGVWCAPYANYVGGN